MNCTSFQSTPASVNAARAAAMPYSTNGLPHLPHGCIPIPSTATSVAAMSVSSPGHGLPPPRQLRHAVDLVHGLDDQLHLRADVDIAYSEPVGDLAEHDELLLRQLGGHDGEGLVGVGDGDIGRRRLVAGVGVAPHRRLA